MYDGRMRVGVAVQSTRRARLPRCFGSALCAVGMDDHNSSFRSGGVSDVLRAPQRVQRFISRVAYTEAACCAIVSRSTVQ